MARTRSGKNKTSSGTKEKASARKAESRVFRKLSRSFEAKLGLDEPDVPMKTVKFKARRKRPKAGAANHPQQQQKLSPETVAHDAEFLSLVERERAAMKSNRARQLRKQKRNKRNKRRTVLKKQEQQEAGADGKQPANSNNSTGFRPHPPSFSLQKSTAQLVNETTSAVHAFGLDSGYVPLPSEWTHRNPNHQQQQQFIANETATSALGHKQNFFATLHEDNGGQENDTTTTTVALKPQPAATKLFAFQPPSFTLESAVAAQPHSGGEIDPDL